MRSIIAILLLFVTAYGYAQPLSDSLQLVTSFGGSIVDFTVDNLGNVYTLDADNRLKKTTATGDSVAVFNNVRQYGKLHAIDATNPLKLLLFYRDFGIIAVLDRFLNVRNVIHLRQKNWFQVRAISQSYDNGIWIYDEQEARLVRLNDEGKLVDQSADLRLLMDRVPSPLQIVDQERLVYLYDPDKGLFVFDYYGSLKNRLAIPGWQDFQVVGGRIFGRKNTRIIQYKSGSLSLEERNLPGVLDGIVTMKISLQHLYCLKDGFVRVYDF